MAMLTLQIDEVRRKRDKMCSTLRDLRAELAKYEREYSQLKHRKRHDDPLLKENRIVQVRVFVIFIYQPFCSQKSMKKLFPALEQWINLMTKFASIRPFVKRCWTR
jgi:hypothetical protein